MAFSNELRKRLLIALTSEKSAEELEKLIIQALANQPAEPPPNQDPDEAKRLVITRKAGEQISALKMVRLEGNQAFVGSSDSLESSIVVGIALNAASSGEDIIILVYGIHEDSFFGFGPNEALYLSSDGSITEVPPTTGVLVRVGSSLGYGQVLLSVATDSITL